MSIVSMGSLLFSLILLLVGAYSIAGQIFFIRELLVQFFGSELCLGIIFSCWFLGIAAGALASGRLCKKLRNPVRGLLLSIVILTLAPFIIISLMRVLRGIVTVLPGEYVSLGKMVLGTVITVFPFSFMIGLIFPIACMAAQKRETAGSNAVGLVYVWESAGSLLGGVIISLAVIPACHPLPVFASLACVIWAAVFSLLLVLQEERPSKTFMAVLPILAGCMLAMLSTGTIAKSEDWLLGLRWDAFQNRYQLLASRDSQYQNLVLAKSADQYGIFADGQFISSYPEEYQSVLKAHLFMCEHSAPGRVLILGNGLTGLVRNILQHPVKTVDYVELDPVAADLAMPILGVIDRAALADQRLHIIYMDGRRFVKHTRGKYDLIIVNAPEPSTAALNRFYTMDFFREVRNALTEDGVMVIGLPASSNYPGGLISEYAASLYAGLKKVFAGTLIIPQEDKSYFFASLKPGLLTSDYRVLTKRYQERGITSASFPPEIFSVLVQAERIESMTKALNRAAGVLANTDMQPITYYYQLLLWATVTGGRLEAGIFKAVARYMIPAMLAMLGIVCVLRSRHMRVAPRKSTLYFNCLWAIAATGCTGMALELVLIFLFQNMYGYIYQMIGIVAGSFMFGLTAGGYTIKRLIAAGRCCGMAALMTCEIMLCLYAVLLPVTIEGLNTLQGTQMSHAIDVTAWSFFMLVFMAGYLTGLEFPLVSHILISHDCDIGAAAGRVDAADHLGACAGSFITGALLVPCAGVYQSCFIMGCINLSGALLTGLQMRMDKNTKTL